MKKMIVVVLLSSLVSHAYEITSTYWSGDTKVYKITCNNGKSVAINSYPKAKKNGANAYYGENTTYRTLSEAVNSRCKRKHTKNIKTLKKGSIICPNASAIKSALRSELHYSTINFDVGIKGKYKNCFNAPVKNMKAIILKSYPQEKNMVDGYYKIDGNGDIYYTRRKSFI